MKVLCWWILLWDTSSILPSTSKYVNLILVLESKWSVDNIDLQRIFYVNIVAYKDPLPNKLVALMCYIVIFVCLLITTRNLLLLSWHMGGNVFQRKFTIKYIVIKNFRSQEVGCWHIARNEHTFPILVFFLEATF